MSYTSLTSAVSSFPRLTSEERGVGPVLADNFRSFSFSATNGDVKAAFIAAPEVAPDVEASEDGVVDREESKGEEERDELDEIEVVDDEDAEEATEESEDAAADAEDADEVVEVEDASS